jgi:hypothetical protein
VSGGQIKVNPTGSKQIQADTDERGIGREEAQEAQKKEFESEASRDLVSFRNGETAI